jgi:hypothetical protein
MTTGELRARLRDVLSEIAHNRRRIGVLRRLAANLRHRLHQRRRPTTMYDSIEIGQIPKGAHAVAGYVGGKWPTFSSLVTAFPRARRLSIAINASEDADCLDIEPGDATVEQAAMWVRRQLSKGTKRPCVYASASQVDGLVVALEAAGIDRSRVRIWSAHYGRGRHLCGPHTCGEVRSTNVDATQYDDRALNRNLDASVLRRSFFT